MPIKDLVTQTFNQLTVLEDSGKRVGTGKVVWRCLCSCGTECDVPTDHLQSGHTKSCGCRKGTWIKHGGNIGRKKTKEYAAYDNAKQRCTNNKRHNYHRYGGRGIQFLFDSFEDFIKEVGPAPDPTFSVDRIDNNGNYERGNLRWVTALQQRENQGY